MKTITITNTSVPALLLIAWLLVPQTAQCFYNSSTGKWLSRDPIEESGGDNVYEFASNDSLNSVDILGLKIRCHCPESYFNESGLEGKYEEAGEDLFVAKPGVSFNGSGDGEILWNMLLTDYPFKAENVRVENLQKNVEARKTIVMNAEKVKWGLGREHFNHPSGPLPSRYDYQAFFDAINNTDTTTGCLEATEIVFNTGNGGRPRGERSKDGVWVPGDWGYIWNKAYNQGHWGDAKHPSTEFAGENVIHIRGQGRQQLFWGHASLNVVLSEMLWWERMQGWLSNDSPQIHGRPGWHEKVWFTRVGLEY